MATNNSINLNEQGLAYYNGTGLFSGLAGPSDSILVGGSPPSFTTTPTITSLTLTTPLPVGSGGTGANSLTGVVIGNNTSAMTALSGVDNAVLITNLGGTPLLLPNGTTGQVLTATTGAQPSWANPAAATITIDGNTGSATGNPITFTGGATGLTFTGAGTTVTLGGTLSPANGGTGGLTGILIGNGASAVSAIAVTQHDVLVGSTGNSITSVSPSTAGFVLTSNGLGNDPSFQASSAGVTSVTGTANQILANPTTGAVALSLIGPYAPTSLTGVLTGNGSGSISGSVVTQFGVIVGGASNAVSSTLVGATGTVLQGNTGAAPTYSTATYPSTTTINDILYSSANNVVGQITAANNGVLISGTTGIPYWLADGGTGQVLTATAGAPPSWTTPTSTNMIWTEEAVSFAAVANNGYFVTGTATVTLPASPLQGDTVIIQDDTAAGVITIVSGNGGQIRVGTNISAVTTGSVSTSALVPSTSNQGNSITLTYRSADTTWHARALEGNWTVT